MKLAIRPLSIPDVKIIKFPRFFDGRGNFAETFSRPDFSTAGLDFDAVQDNELRSERQGTVRGLHFQRPPFAQAKLVRVLQGRIFDVVVDLRHSSPTNGRHVAVELSAADDEHLFVPAGFAHGFCTLVPDTVVQYKVDQPYAPTHEDGINWDDSELGIQWPVAARDAILSDKDQRLPMLSELFAVRAASWGDVR